MQLRNPLLWIKLFIRMHGIQIFIDCLLKQYTVHIIRALIHGNRFFPGCELLFKALRNRYDSGHICIEQCILCIAVRYIFMLDIRLCAEIG